MEWVEKNIRSEYQLDSKGRLQCDSETSTVVRVGDGDPDEETGGGDGGDRVEVLRFSLGVTRMDKIRNEYIRL